jgi:hypothetical protein
MSGLIAACHKNSVEIKGSRDLKNLSLQELKYFLNGKWRLQYTINFTIAGRDSIPGYETRSYIVFYPVDSIMGMSDMSTVINKGKVAYEWLPISNSESAYVIKNDDFGYLDNCVADKLLNDTLVFANYFQSEGINRYYFTREQ